MAAVPAPRLAGPAAVAFTTLFVCTWRVVEPSLLYECTTFFPAFLCGRQFAADFFWRPGGPVEYLAALLYQSYYYSWGGALVTTAVAVVLCGGAGACLGSLRGRAVSPWAAFVPALLVLAEAGQYGCHLASLLALAVALLVAAAYLRARERRLPPAAAAGVYLGACLALSYLAAGAMLMFALLAALYELRRAPRPVLAAAYLLVALIVPQFVGVVWLDVPRWQAWLGLLPLADPAYPQGLDPLGLLPLQALWLYPPLAAVIAALWPVRQGGSGLLVRAERLPAVRWGLPLLLVLLVCLTTGSSTVRHCLRAQRYFVQGQWAAALGEAARLPGPAVIAPLTHQANAALANQGRLLDAMFAYPQQPAGLIIGTAADQEAQWEDANLEHLIFYPQLGAQDLELGLVNEAERQAHEALEVWGPHPVVLRRLALINCLRGQRAAAAVYLGALAGDLNWRRYVRQALAELPGGIPRCLQADVARLRPQQRRDDSYMGRDFGLHCRALLADNPRNRLAVQYLLAYHLLRREPWWCAEDLGLLRAAGFTQLPRHLQEAMVLLEADDGRTPDLQGYRIDSSVRTSFAGFNALMEAAQAAGNVEHARGQAAPDYGDTYYYYYAFQQSGVARR